ncbi:MAG: serine/threonine protein kinase [Planctomycetes bacterium]|nr:serine/threonine protein kinase [Planctomycetota bacterium]
MAGEQGAPEGEGKRTQPSPILETEADGTATRPAPDVAATDVPAAARGEARVERLPSLPRFEEMEEVGAGAMGVVYRARDAKLDRPVALKFLRESLSSRPEFRERFEREARAAARLDHPNIMRIHDVLDEGGGMGLVLEWVEGRTLQSILAERGLGRRALLELLRRAALGVAHAHGAGIVHRDLKPANILVSTTGEPKIADFGLARLGFDASSLTEAGSRMGTPAYMAPEQIEGAAERIGPATDVFALGVILFEVLTGRMPFSGGTLTELLGHILAGRPPRPCEIDPTIPADLEAICMRAMEKDPRRRYRTADSFAEELGRHLRSAPERGRRASRRSRARSRPAGPALVAISATILAVAGATLPFLLFSNRGSEAERPLDFTGPAGRILWLGRDGSYALRRIDASGASETVAVWAEDAGQSPRSSVRFVDGTLGVLRSHGDGFAWVGKREDAASLRSLPPAPEPSGWQARNYVELPDGTARLAWTGEGGRIAIARLDQVGGSTGGREYGPLDGWIAASYHARADGHAAILWRIGPSLAQVWLLGADDEYTGHVDLEAHEGWTPVELVLIEDGGGCLLWANEAGEADLWWLDQELRRVHGRTYGPFEGARAVAYGGP